MHMYNRLNMFISEAVNKVYDERSGDELMPYFSEISSYLWRMT